MWGGGAAQPSHKAPRMPSQRNPWAERLPAAASRAPRRSVPACRGRRRMLHCLPWGAAVTGNCACPAANRPRQAPGRAAARRRRMPEVRAARRELRVHAALLQAQVLQRAVGRGRLRGRAFRPGRRLGALRGLQRGHVRLHRLARRPQGRVGRPHCRTLRLSAGPLSPHQEQRLTISRLCRIKGRTLYMCFTRGECGTRHACSVSASVSMACIHSEAKLAAGSGRPCSAAAGTPRRPAA